MRNVQQGSLAKVGDVVWLNSGSPDLTVVESTADEVVVKWESEPDNRMRLPKCCVCQRIATASVLACN
jgi:hypothetical protein